MLSSFKHERQNTHLLENHIGGYFVSLFWGIISSITCKIYKWHRKIDGIHWINMKNFYSTKVIEDRLRYFQFKLQINGY